MTEKHSSNKMSCTYLLCSLGKRKASERMDGTESQEPRHTKRAAIPAEAPAESAHADPHNHDQSMHSNDNAEGGHRQQQSQGSKRTAEVELPHWEAAGRDSSSMQGWQQSASSSQQPSMSQRSVSHGTSFMHNPAVASASVPCHTELPVHGMLAHLSCFCTSCRLMLPDIRSCVGNMPRPVTNKRYRVVREPFKAPLTPVEQAAMQAPRDNKRRRHRIHFAGEDLARCDNCHM